MLRLEMLPADYGDCLWLEYGSPGDTRAVIIDGGPAGIYQRALRPRIESFIASRRCGRAIIELLIVTHIDNDHILGALELVQDAALAVDISEVWFNGWEQIAPRDLLGVKEGVDLSKAIAERKLNHNATFGGGAVVLDKNAPPQQRLLANGLAITILSPGPAQLKRLATEWDSVVAEMDDELLGPKDLLGEPAMDVNELAEKRFKPDNAVANGSSIALLVEYEGHRILLAADSFAPVVADALRGLGYSERNRVSLDALKMSHHGSRGNNSSELLQLIRCPLYLFSTNGARFNHPHEECVARVLVHGGKNITIGSNYRRGSTALWNLKKVLREYKHSVLEPTEGDEGLLIDFS